MQLTRDESRALAFVAVLVLLSAAVRLATLPAPLEPAGTSLDLDRHVAATLEAVTEEQRRSRPLEPGERIDPNRAPAPELDRLPGVGPRLADRILAARKDGLFRSVDDLTRVSGIGPRTATRLAPHLTLPGSMELGPSAPRVERTAARLVAPGDRQRRPRAPAGEEGPLNVNTADQEALTRLPYVGPVLAARIVAYRDSVGPFPAVDSLVRVRGIGSATLERLKGRIRVQ